jgi:hypothetical protein
MTECKWFYRGVKFQNGSVTKELDLHSPYSCPQIVVSSRELLSASSFYSLFPPMRCFMNSMIILKFTYILIAKLRVKTVSMMVMMKKSSFPRKAIVYSIS